MRCPSCDHLNEAGANFCSRCGSPLASADAEAVAAGRSRLGAVRESAPLTVLDRHFRS
jgi:hypothetical protein